MAKAEQIKKGNIILLDGKLHKVTHLSMGGAAKAGRIVHIGMMSTPEGIHCERAFQGNENIEVIMTERYSMQYLYNDADSYYFMNTKTYEQLQIPEDIVGPVAPYLKEDTEIQVEFYKGKPVNMLFPDTVELRVTQAPPGLPQMDSTTMKEATLENGMKILVPQFISTGDTVKVDVESGKYLERLRKSSRSP